MSADAHVSAARLRLPPSLASDGSNRLGPRRALQRQHLLALRPGIGTGGDGSASSSGAGGVGAATGHPARGAHALPGGALAHAVSFEPDAFDGPYDLLDGGGGNGGGGGGAGDGAWLDVDRFEDWDRPTLDVLRPNIRVAFEEELFPVAVAEDGETLPSELHPSYPYGDLHAPSTPYIRASKLPANQYSGHSTDMVSYHAFHHDYHTARRPSALPAAPISERMVARARQMTGNNPAPWPFRRFGPGQGGPSALARAESRRPWRPYRAVWTDLDLEGLAHAHQGLPCDPLKERQDQERRRQKRARRCRGPQTPPAHSHVKPRPACEDVARPAGPPSLLAEIDSLLPEPEQYDGEEAHGSAAEEERGQTPDAEARPWGFM